jgi:hypothetical protein
MTNPLKKYPELVTKKVFLIGNGSSRKDFDLNTLVGKGTIIGCNALYRDFKPDILICQDAKMARELYDNDYTGLVLSGKGVGVKNENLITWKVGDARTSGAFGLKFISTMIKPDVCYVLGMDGYDGNVYANTHNYNKGPVKIHKIAAQYGGAARGTHIVNVNTKSTWDSCNYVLMSYEEFKARVAQL